jgi:SPX domain protein involved in polyphosphate accumulation
MSKTQPEDLRQELKFVIPAEDRHRALHQIRTNDGFFCKQYPDRQVNNIYFDSHDYDAYWDNLSGVSTRRKTRYRWYGSSLVPTAGAMEQKFRRNHLNWKQLNKVQESIARENDSWFSIRRKLISCLPRELSHHLYENPVPVLVNRYQRSYFISRESDIRITLDTELTFHKQGNILPNFTRKVSLSNYIILEIKFPVRSKDKYLKLMPRFPFPVSRCSKYCIGVQAINQLTL